MAWAPPPAMAASLLLLLLLCLAATTAAAPQTPPSPPPPTSSTLGGQLVGALGRAGSVAGDLLGRLSLPAAQERIRDAYEKGSAAVMTYTGILTDQIYHWWQGEE